MLKIFRLLQKLISDRPQIGLVILSELTSVSGEIIRKPDFRRSKS